MKRLTIRTDNGAALRLDNPTTEQEAREQLKAAYRMAINKLADYEDAEEQGRMITRNSRVQFGHKGGKKNGRKI